MAEIKNCPFCGSEAKLFQSDKINNFAIVCQDEDLLCCVRLLYCNSKEEAIQQWNKRV